MILYFADRQLKILGQASTKLPKGITIIDDLKTEEVETGVATFECKVAFDKETRTLAEKCCAVGNYLLRSNGNENEFYIILDYELDIKKQQILVYAEDAGLDLLNEVVGEYEADKEYPISHYIERFSYDSGFEIGVNEVDNLVAKLSFDKEESAIARLASVAQQFGGCEIAYSYAIKGLTITHKYINIYAKRGKDEGAQLRFNDEVDNIITTKSIAHLATAYRCTGSTPDDSDSPITLYGYKYDDGDFYVSGDGLLCSRNAFEKWSRYLWAKEPNQDSTEQDGHIVKTFSYSTTSQAELCKKAIAELKIAREVEVNYEITVSKLPDNIGIGDRVNIIDDAGNLYLSARILKLETSVVNNEQQATLGEYLIKGSGIAAKVQNLANQFAKQSVDAARALSIANAAKSLADGAQTQANAAVTGAATAQQAADEAAAAANIATQSAQEATQAANNAQAAVGVVEANVAGLEATIVNAQAAAEQARQAAITADTKAVEAKQAAVNAQTKADEAKAAAGTAQTDANTAKENAATAKTTAEQAKVEAAAASQTAAAAKLDAETAQEEIDALGENLTTLQNTMSVDYARKTDLTEATASLQTQITQNANEISSTATSMQRIDETVA